MQTLYKVIVYVALMTLAGCGAYLNETYLTSESIQNNSWASRDLYIPCPIYCYRTLGKNECFSTPQFGRESALIEYYDHTTANRRCFTVEEVITVGQPPWQIGH